MLSSLIAGKWRFSKAPRASLWLQTVAMLSLSVSIAGGCATYSDKTAKMRNAVARGDYPGGLKEVDSFLKVKDPGAMPKKFKSDTALAVLERATILLAMNKSKESELNFQTAEKQLELLDIAKDTGGEIAKYLYSDSATKYKTPPVERLALNGFNMINYMVQGDLQGARVEAKRFTVMRTYLKDYDPKHAHGTFASYLAGFVFEKLGEYDSAMLYYSDALEAQSFPSLTPAIERLSHLTSYRSEEITKVLGEPPATPPVAESVGKTPTELLIIVNLGRVPYKVPERIPIGLAIGIGAAFFTGSAAVLERSAMKFIVYPQLVPAKNVFNSATISVDGQAINLELASDLSTEVVQEYEELKPKIIGAALTRLVARAAVAEGARAAGNASGSGVVGVLASLFVEGALVALDKPDTRSWTLMPSQVHIARVQVPAGKHTVDVNLFGKAQGNRKIDVNVEEGRFVVLDVTTLR